ncbi:unnamed protein product [Polarella glacialis]|uniref:Uncharacterized protein n=1 Tax=Polarella glacialis TaxID=89957 RepID=A0A813I6M4_POLGL|nr:unnamed protein product [Polarella glacialis]CAE8645468.1 unnamed protein product [Polarella glacialis]
MKCNPTELRQSHGKLNTVIFGRLASRNPNQQHQRQRRTTHTKQTNNQTNHNKHTDDAADDDHNSNSNSNSNSNNNNNDNNKDEQKTRKLKIKHNTAIREATICQEQIGRKSNAKLHANCNTLAKNDITGIGVQKLLLAA